MDLNDWCQVAVSLKCDKNEKENLGKGGYKKCTWHVQKVVSSNKEYKGTIGDDSL
jgi:hypothetical protein